MNGINGLTDPRNMVNPHQQHTGSPVRSAAGVFVDSAGAVVTAESSPRSSPTKKKRRINEVPLAKVPSLKKEQPEVQLPQSPKVSVSATVSGDDEEIAPSSSTPPHSDEELNITPATKSSNTKIPGNARALPRLKLLKQRLEQCD
jgi:hypothetical protein